MKHPIRILFVGLCVLLAAACSRHKIISDRELARIFHDAFLTNAYIGSQNLRIDSLKIYEPIFARHGYTTEDVQYTIGNFSKRKSARLGDVVEQAIDLLESEGSYFDREVTILDTIDNVARRTMRRTVLADSLIRVRSLRDTARLSFRLDVQPGEYTVSLRYIVDSLDQNERGLRSSMWLDRHDGTRTNPTTNYLRRTGEGSLDQKFKTDSTHKQLRISLLNFLEKPRTPSITITNFKVEYTPPLEKAVDSLYQQQLDIRIFADEFFRAAAPTVHAASAAANSSAASHARSKDSL